MDEIKEKVDFILLASGEGNRFSKHKLKQFATIGNLSILEISVINLLKWKKTHRVIIVCLKKVFLETKFNKEKTIIRNILKNNKKNVLLTYGGKNRQDSVLKGLNFLKKQNNLTNYVGIHDCARPFVKVGVLNRLHKKIISNDCVIPTMPVKDTLKSFSRDNITKTIDRKKTVVAQTPQFFKRDIITSLHSKIKRNKNKLYTDDASILEDYNYTIKKVTGDSTLEKITYNNDLEKLVMNFEYRTGLGFDVHKFSNIKSKPLIIFGINFDYHKSLQAHSDGDVGYHALCDALLGSMALEDIGYFFPPSEKKWKNKDSEYFLNFALKKLNENNALINNIDITIICENPKITPYRTKILKKLSKITKTNENRISLKSSTTEKLGFLGREEGISVLVQVSIKILNI